MKKIIGYLIAVLGIIGIAAYSIPQFKAVLGIPSSINDTTLLIASLIIAAIGVFLSLKGNRTRAHSEVPIFHGKHVVGYRRH